MFTRNRVLGRNKIQDVWNNVPHKVVARPFPEGNVYVVEPLDGNDAQKTIHRRDLLDTRTLVEDVNPDRDDENPPEGQPDVNHVGEKDQHEDGEPVEVIFHTKPPATNSGGQIPPPTPSIYDNVGEQPSPVTSEDRRLSEKDVSVVEHPTATHEDESVEPQLRRSARLQGRPPSLSSEIVADITRSHLLFMQMFSNMN